MASFRAFARVNPELKPQTQAIHFVVTQWDKETGIQEQKPFAVADVLVLEVGIRAEQGVMLYRYTATGVFCGDTWHESVEDAKHQAVYEFGAAVEGWFEIPPSVTNATEYALTKIRAWP